MSPTRVLLRTEELAFIDKPAGMLVHCSAWAGPREHALVDDVALLLGRGWHPLHRLDRQTSGVVAFACEGSVARWQLALASADKRYWALVRGHVLARVEVDHPLRDEPRAERGAAHATDAADAAADAADAPDAGKPARSVVTPLLRSSVERCSLVEVRLLSGRRHQARRHLKHIAHPVIGDANHGKGPLNRAYRATWGVTRMALHARALAFADDSAPPVVAPLPADLRAPFVTLFGADAIAELEAR